VGEIKEVGVGENNKRNSRKRDFEFFTIILLLFLPFKRDYSREKGK